MKRPKPKGRSTKKQAWDAFSLYIRELDDWTCCTCGKRNYRNKEGGPIMQAGHLITRKKAATLYDQNNVFCQCRDCNHNHQFNPQIMTAWFLAEFGAEAYEALELKSRQVCQRKRVDELKLVEWFTGKRQAVESGDIPHRTFKVKRRAQ